MLGQMSRDFEILFGPELGYFEVSAVGARIQEDQSGFIEV